MSTTPTTSTVVPDPLQALILKNQDNLTALGTIPAPSFVSSPEFRGTTNIVFSCVITLIACIYTALHLNVPTSSKFTHTIASKAKWVFIGLIAPEIVLYLAISQFLEARDLVKELNVLLASRPPSTDVESAAAGGNTRDKYTFNLKYGFFVVMGGVEVPVHDIERPCRRGSRGEQGSGRLRLTSYGVLQLARDGHYIDIPTSRIDDKSKVDVIEKILVVTQMTWMAIQCIVRKVYGLPLSLLEIHTMVHVVCAVTMFFLWIHKPKDVQDPEVLDISGFEDIIALMYQESLVPTGQCSMSSSTMNCVKKLYPAAPIGSDGVISVENGREKYLLRFGQRFWFGLGVEASDEPFSADEEALAELGVPIPDVAGASFKPADILRWQRIIQAIERKEGPIRHPQCFSQKPFPMRYPDCDYHLAFSPRIGNLQQITEESQTLDAGFEIVIELFRAITNPTRLSKMPIRSRLMTTLLIFMPVVYGGIHLTALHFDFPSLVESKLWFVSSVYTMAALPGLTMVGTMFTHFVFRTVILKRLGCAIFLVFVTVLAFVVALLGYVLARMYLVVESFISLRAQPIGLYWTPSWLQMIPHV